MAEKNSGEKIRRKTEEFQKKAESFYEDRGRVFRTLWTVVAVTIILAGIGMMILPGPAVVVIPLGFAMLSLQFAWAGKVLDKAVDAGEVVEKRYNRLGTTGKVLLWLAIACFAAAGIALFLLI